MSGCLKIYFLSLVLWLPAMGVAQNAIIGSVRDQKTKEALIFLHIIKSGTTESYLTNDDGFFRLNSVQMTDTIEFVYLGYESKKIAGKDFKPKMIVELSPNSILIEEIKIIANDDYLISMVEKCTKKSKKAFSATSKAYLEINSQDEFGPLELLRFYYNASIKGPKVEDLRLKNGQAALINDPKRYFISLGTSQAILLLNPLDNNDRYPMLPLSMNRKNIKKHFWLTKLPELADQDILRVEFEPKNDIGKYFRGEIWMRKSDQQMLKLVLLSDNTRIHPFEPFKPEDVISNLGFNVTYHFNKVSDGIAMSLLEFNFTFDYEDHKSSIPEHRKISTQGILHFYDYSEPFFIPLFYYNPNHNDYRKIALIPYDSIFWSHHQGLEFTEAQRQRMEVFEKNGFKLNFDEKKKDVDTSATEDDFLAQGHFFEHNNIVWKKNTFIRLPPKPSIGGRRYAHFVVQLFFDVHQHEKRLYYTTKTIFDIFNTNYELEMNKEELIFFNIYFDLCEIERIKMEQKYQRLLQLQK
ncbi:MAG: carboxypeptidase-like regulatory domain-containing protein [Saprospiraceae bacterium]|nr:carboxypeptidase-like regulatory domain-containing protein [Saprospiraceae bacterium]